jgi:polyisoprenoid-binding protein YceI
MGLKLKAVDPGCKLRLCGVLFLAGALSACPTRPPAPPAPLRSPAVVPPAAPRIGRPYDLDAQQSLLTVLVYRGGALSSAGHNHVIASHGLTGSVYLPPELGAASFEVHVPVASLTVDEAQLRAAQSAAAFPPDVSDGAREGTRRNMLSAAVLDAADYPEVVLRCARLEGAPNPPAGDATAPIDTDVRGRVHTLRVPLHYELAGDTLTVTGEMALRQSELGLTPFTALLGALAVEDEMRVSFRIVARAAPLGH